MKTSSEYRSLAWNELRENFSASSKLAAVLLCVGAFVVVLSYLSTTLCEQQGTSILYGELVAVVLFLIRGMLDYYMTVGYQQLVRRSPVQDILDDAAGKIVLCAAVMTLPSLVQDVLKALNDHSLSMSFLILAVAIGVIVYSYAINALLPYIIRENKDLSILQAMQKSEYMIRGYKGKLFVVDLKIWIWPILVWFALFMLTIFAAVIEDPTAAEQGDLPMYVWSTFVLLGLYAVFVGCPMMYIARAHFWEDLQSEPSPVEEG